MAFPRKLFMHLVPELTGTNPFSAQVVLCLARWHPPESRDFHHVVGEYPSW